MMLNILHHLPPGKGCGRPNSGGDVAVSTGHLIRAFCVTNRTSH